ncbi:LuxR C-terminal-related transcriptional regulator [Streptomyces sp. NPDC058657]|uniref:LuxR C-terminal-related transcriptional regulator n=1 Tax=unclassified Streptomyces TaxID=2593676 RepID=UPI003657E41A
MDLTASEQTTVLIVDDDPVTRTGVQHIIGALPGVRVLAAIPCRSPLAALDEHEPDIILVSAATASPDGTSSAFNDMLNHAGHHLVVSFGLAPGSYLNPELLSAGLSGVLPHQASPEDFGRAIQAVKAGYVYYPRKATREFLHHRAPIPYLSPREREVLDLLADGLSNQHIARSLGIKESTVKMYVTRLLHKLQVESRLQACLKARGLTNRWPAVAAQQA